MRVTATSDVVRIMGVWIRRADAGLVTGAARNAAHSVESERARRLDDARTMRDLQSIPRTSAARAAAQNG